MTPAEQVRCELRKRASDAGLLVTISLVNKRAAGFPVPPERSVAYSFHRFGSGRLLAEFVTLDESWSFLAGWVSALGLSEVGS